MNWKDFDSINTQGNERVNVIPIMTVDEDAKLETTGERPETIPILTMRNVVLFPGTLIPVTVGREKSIKLINAVDNGDKILGTVTQLDPREENPGEQDLFNYGCLARIVKVIEMPDNSKTIIIQGIQRFKVDRYVQKEPFFVAQVTYCPEITPSKSDKDFKSIADGIKDVALQILETGSSAKEAEFALKNMDNSAFMVNFIASSMELEDFTDKLHLLEIDDLKERAKVLLEILYKELEIVKLRENIRQKAKGAMSQQQREYYLNNQLRTIQDELGISSDLQDIQDLRDKAAQHQWPESVRNVFDKEIAKLERLNPSTPDYNVQQSYLQFMVDLPWEKCTKDNLDLNNAQKVLDRDHYGLEKVKERILEYLAVLKLKGDLKSPILCLYGPPGVGKTSLGQSIANALGRKFVRISLGGLHDEAEIRGHRRTYIGAMAGRILQNIERCGSSNPVVVLDEIDKVGNDYKGDPASALLEVLDPEQNSTFHDNYLDVDYDLSKVLFITTANQTSTISSALKDRMEMIEVTGYVPDEKHKIAVKHLIPKEMKLHGLDKVQIHFSKDAIDTIINEYTCESGVRSLDRQIAKIMRHRAKEVAMYQFWEREIKTKDVIEILGNKRVIRDVQKGNEFPGVVTGLAWSEAGGDILFIETSLCPGKGELSLTGNLGDVMKESATIALQYLKAHTDLIGFDPKEFEKINIHIHVPEGAIPKDGPSAGITMVSSIASALKREQIRSGIAMTGEISLRGKVLPVGGIKEKILAAKRAGINTIVLCEENRQDIAEIKPEYINGMEFHYVKTIDEVLEYIFSKD